MLHRPVVFLAFALIFAGSAFAEDPSESLPGVVRVPRPLACPTRLVGGGMLIIQTLM